MVITPAISVTILASSGATKVITMVAIALTTASISKSVNSLKISFVKVSPYSLAISSNATFIVSFSVKVATTSYVARTNLATG